MRTAVAASTGKAIAFLSRRLNLGGGTTFPGYVAQQLDPHLLGTITARLEQGCVVVTGTNGKTTTARILSNIVRVEGMEPVHNRSGANLVDGVSSALLQASDWRGVPRGDIGLFEVDEASLPRVVAEVQPRVIVVTNLFRDQLDRYGEIDYVARLWRQALATLPSSSTVILNADDPLVASLGAGTPARVRYYGIEHAPYSAAELPHTADSRFCLACGSPYQYEAVYYGHLGRYTCPRCGAVRPQPGIYAERVQLQGTQGSDVGLVFPDGRLGLHVRLPGLYNVYNALAALSAGWTLGLSMPVLKQGVESAAAAFGRIERVPIDGKQAFLALVKNPVGFNQVLSTLFLDNTPKDLAILINDHFADGTDISWLWDVDFELLQGRVRSAVVAGTRAEDMQLRLKYAGVDMGQVSLRKDPREALAEGLRRVGPGETLYVLPTYTAMLEVRQAMAEMGHVGRFWED